MAIVFTSLRPILRTKDLKGTIAFYTQRLGFVCEGFSAEDGWASLRRNAVELMVAMPNAHVPFDAPVFTGSLYINVDDVAALWAEVKVRATKNTKVSKASHEERPVRMLIAAR